MDINEVVAWLNQYQGREIFIQKEEDGDIDQVEMTLQRADMGHLEERDPDDYLAQFTILLHGEGTVGTGMLASDLPQSVYDIPLTKDWQATLEQGHEKLTIHSERGTYLIQPVG